MLTGAPFAAVPGSLTRSGLNTSAGRPARPELAQAPRCASRSPSLAHERAEQTKKTGSFQHQLTRLTPLLKPR